MIDDNVRSDALNHHDEARTSLYTVNISKLLTISNKQRTFASIIKRKRIESNEKWSDARKKKMKQQQHNKPCTVNPTISKWNNNNNHKWKIIIRHMNSTISVIANGKIEFELIWKSITHNIISFCPFEFQSNISRERKKNWWTQEQEILIY